MNTSSNRNPVGLILVILVLAGVAYFLGTRSNQTETSSAKTPWVAVTLDTQATYFGQIEGAQISQFVNLANAYFARENPDKKSEDDGLPRFLLSKVGTAELYGPESLMQINRDHILLIQELRDDSQVIKTITSQEE